MKNPNDPIRNRTRDLPACEAVPQPTVLPRIPSYIVTILIKFSNGQTAISRNGLNDDVTNFTLFI
jgi:hypothetical protein